MIPARYYWMVITGLLEVAFILWALGALRPLSALGVMRLAKARAEG